MVYFFLFRRPYAFCCAYLYPSVAFVHRYTAHSNATQLLQQIIIVVYHAIDINHAIFCIALDLPYLLDLIRFGIWCNVEELPSQAHIHSHCVTVMIGNDYQIMCSVTEKKNESRTNKCLNLYSKSIVNGDVGFPQAFLTITLL